MNLNTSVLFLLLFLCPIVGTCQIDTVWTNVYGGTDDEEGYCCQQTADGGFILLGYTETYTYDEWPDYYLVKTDSNGDMLWDATFGGIYPDEGYSVKQTFDGGYILIGFSAGDLWSSALLVKVNSNGDWQWSQNLGNPNGSAFGYDVLQTEDSGYIIAGNIGISSNDYYLVKTSSNGMEEWSTSFGGSDEEYGKSIAYTSDGGYIIAGYSYSHITGQYKVYLVKTDGGGTLEWSQTLGDSLNEVAKCIKRTNDGGYIIAGYVWPTEVWGKGVLLIKTDESGDEVWSRIYSDELSDAEGHSVLQTDDGGYIIAGRWRSNLSLGWDVYVIRTDASGNELWSKSIGGEQSEAGYHIDATNDGGYIVLGSTWSYGAGRKDFYAIRLTTDTTSVDETYMSEIQEFRLYDPFPNPFNTSTKISYNLARRSMVTLSIYNVQGIKVTCLLNNLQNRGTYKLIFSDSNLTSGLYFVELSTDTFHEITKLLLIK